MVTAWIVVPLALAGAGWLLVDRLPPGRVHPAVVPALLACASLAVALVVLTTPHAAAAPLAPLGATVGAVAAGATRSPL